LFFQHSDYDPWLNTDFSTHSMLENVYLLLKCVLTPSCSIFRFEYHAAAEVVKEVEFEEVDGKFNAYITHLDDMCYP
jgi:hypothetical protein